MTQTDSYSCAEQKEISSGLDPLDALRSYATLMVFILHGVAVSGVIISSKHFYLNQPAWAGVWILYILSGYLIGKGFKNNKYDNKIQYLKRRFTRIGIPYYVFIFIVILLVYPSFAVDHPTAILRILTFTYNGNPGVVGVGATWFISTIMQFYIIALLFNWIVKKICGYRHTCKLFLIILFASGVILRVYMYDVELDWNIYVYTLSLTNLDLFFGGFLLNYWANDNKERNRAKTMVFRTCSIIILVSLMMFFAYCTVASVDHMAFYMYLGPSATLIATCLYIQSFDVKKDSRQKLSFKSIRKNPIKLIEAFSVISFGFYLWHSNILTSVASAFEFEKEVSSLLILLFVSCILTILIATIFYFSVEKMSAKVLSRPSQELKK